MTEVGIDLIERMRRMKKQLLIVSITLVLLVVGLSGCVDNPFQSEEDKLLGLNV